MTKYFYTAIALLACIFLPAQQASGTVIGFESLPTSHSTHVSRHGVAGPVLADDFMSAISGVVRAVEWWGAAPLSGGNDLWELTFHSDAGGTPSTVFPTGVLTQHLLTVAGTDSDGDGIYHYRAQWNPADLFVLANTDYWFSAANASGSTWTWANGAAPTIGSEMWNAAVSTGVGPNGGPHFGPWNTLVDTNFAFRVIVNPEPGIIALLGIGLIGVGFAHRRKVVA